MAKKLVTMMTLSRFEEFNVREFYQRTQAMTARGPKYRVEHHSLRSSGCVKAWSWRRLQRHADHIGRIAHSDYYFELRSARARSCTLSCRGGHDGNYSDPQLLGRRHIFFWKRAVGSVRKYLSGIPAG